MARQRVRLAHDASQGRGNTCAKVRDVTRLEVVYDSGTGLNQNSSQLVADRRNGLIKGFSGKPHEYRLESNSSQYVANGLDVSATLRRQVL